MKKLSDIIKGAVEYAHEMHGIFTPENNAVFVKAAGEHIYETIDKHRPRQIETIQDMADAMIVSFKQAAKESGIKPRKFTVHYEESLLLNFQNELILAQSANKKKKSHRENLKPPEDIEQLCKDSSSNVISLFTKTQSPSMKRRNPKEFERSLNEIAKINMTFTGTNGRQLKGIFSLKAFKTYDNNNDLQIMLQSSFYHKATILNADEDIISRHPVIIGQAYKDVKFTNIKEYSTYLGQLTPSTSP